MVADRRPVLAGCGTICPMPTTGRPISLAHLTVLDATPPELVTVAADAGFRSIGIRLTATPSVGVPPYDILGDGPLLRETLRRLADTGVSVLDTEFLRFAQICDAGPDMPGPTDTPALIREARTGRLLPGDGVLPLAELVGVLPPTVPLAIEAPCRATAELPAAERAKRAYRALTALLEKSRRRDVMPIFKRPDAEINYEVHG